MRRFYQKTKKAVAVTLCIATAMSMAACGSSTTKEETTTTESTTADGVTKESSEASKDVVELTVHDIYNGTVVDFSLPVITKIQENVGVHLTNSVASSSTDDDQAWTLMIASPDTMPDIIVSPSMDKMEKLGVDGGLIPLEDYIAKSCPNITAAFEQYPELKAASTASDGHIYEICSMKEMKSSFTYIIRQDWLDTLGLAMPTTVDELHDVLLAFRTQDPNGNGEQDEIPFISRWGVDNQFTNQALGLWNSGTDLMVRDGKVIFDPAEANFKVGMQNLVQWYSEGIIDPEVYTREDARNVLYGENKGGFTLDWPASTTQYNQSLAETVPGFKNVVMGVPKDQNGDQVMKFRSTPTAGVGISANCKNVEAALKLIDYLYSEEGQILSTFGIEGENYTKDGDKYTFMESMTSYEGGITAAREKLAGCINHLGGIDPLELEYAIVTNDETLEGYELYHSNEQWYPEDEYAQYGFKYTADELQEIDNLLPGIKTYVNEKCMSWILGNGNFEDEYDGFIAELKTRGIDRVVEISQAAYDRVKQ